MSDTFTSTTTSVDTIPDLFLFTDQVGVAVDTQITSNSITVTGINRPSPISATGGEYRIGSGAYTSVAGTVNNGQTVTVRHLSSASFQTTTDSVLTIGGVSDTFTSTTGPINTGFNQAQGFNDSARNILPANDGSGDIYVGGSFISYYDTRANRIIRLNSDGSVDTDFAVGTGFNSTVTSLVLATDGSGDIYVGGAFGRYDETASRRIIRLNSDGTVDTAFTIGTGFNSFVTSLAPATDGSGDIYVGGKFGSYNGTDSSGIIRLNSDGTVDEAFTVGKGFNGRVDSLVSTTDGSGDIYVGGIFNRYDGTDSKGVIRLNSDGSVDTVFAVGTGFDDTVTALALASDGSGDLYVGGPFTAYKGTGSNYIIRLNSDGTRDTAFVVGSGFDQPVNKIAVTAGGHVYVSGSFSAYNGISRQHTIRLNSDGSVDTAFVVGTGFDDTTNGLALATDGSADLYVGGLFAAYNGTGSNRIIRLNSNGSVDSAFVAGSGGFNDIVRAIAPATDGSGDVYVGGQFTAYNGVTSNNLIRLNSNGTIDAAFVVGTGFNEPVDIIVATTDGSGDIYVSGDFSDYNGTGSNRIIRLNSDGTPDTTFAVGTGFSSVVTSLALATDGSGDLYVGGYFTSYNGTEGKGIIRLNRDGSVDTTFVVGTGFSINGIVYALAVATDGSGDIYVGGDFRSYNGTESNYIIRLNSDGTPDTDFDMSVGFDRPVTKLAAADDGVYVGGEFDYYLDVIKVKYITRLWSDGAITVKFGFDGQTGQALLDDDVSNIVVATDGSGDVYLGGTFSRYGDTPNKYLVRLNEEGRVKASFAVGSGFNWIVSSLAAANDGSGDVFVGGWFTSYKGTTVDNIVRLTPKASIK